MVLEYFAFFKALEVRPSELDSLKVAKWIYCSTSMID
jgi:hypothetical protein